MIENINGSAFFIERLEHDINFRTEIQTTVNWTSKKEIRDDIKQLRADVNEKLRPPKVYISVRELEDTYSISESQQKGLRGRVKNPLPFYQDRQGGKIRYKVTEVEEWMGQQKVKRGI